MIQEQPQQYFAWAWYEDGEVYAEFSTSIENIVTDVISCYFTEEVDIEYQDDNFLVSLTDRSGQFRQWLVPNSTQASTWLDQFALNCGYNHKFHIVDVTNIVSYNNRYWSKK